MMGFPPRRSVSITLPFGAENLGRLHSDRSGTERIGDRQTDVRGRYNTAEDYAMASFNVRVHQAEEGGFWAEVPALPGCVAQGETLDELLADTKDAIGGCLSVQLASGDHAASADKLSRRRRLQRDPRERLADVISSLEFATICDDYVRACLV